jgi:drug/metabolite transporter (DMT)-like permease
MGGYQVDLFRLNRVGLISGVVSSLFFAFYSLYGEKGLKRYDPWTIVLFGFGFGALFYWIVASPSSVFKANYSLNVWLAFLYIAILSGLLGDLATRYIILRCGSDKTYQFIRLLLEALSKSKNNGALRVYPHST